MDFKLKFKHNLFPSFHVVNIFLRDKPDWFTPMTPTALVPVLRMPGEDSLVYESFTTVEYLDEKFPEVARMHRDTPEKRAEDRALVELSKRVRD